MEMEFSFRRISRFAFCVLLRSVGSSDVERRVRGTTAVHADVDEFDVSSPSSFRRALLPLFRHRLGGRLGHPYVGAVDGPASGKRGHGFFTAGCRKNDSEFEPMASTSCHEKDIHKSACHFKSKKDTARERKESSPKGRTAAP